MAEKLGYIRENSKNCDGVDDFTKINRTGLDIYLTKIFPNTNDWIYDKAFGEHNGVKYKIRPDYRSESLKLIVEYDGIQHYNNPSIILNDIKNEEIYKNNGYKVVRIPYFIQLDKEVVKKKFDVDINEDLFDTKYPSIGGIDRNSNPSYLCVDGIKRMVKEFSKYPKQYSVNMKALKDMNNPILSGCEYLEYFYNKFNNFNNI